MRYVFTFLALSACLCTQAAIIYDSGGFESYTAGAITGQYGWQGVENPDRSVIQTNVVRQGAKALCLTGTTAVVYPFSALSTGVIKVSYDLQMRNGGSNTFLLRTSLRNAGAPLVSFGMYDGGAFPALSIYGDADGDGHNEYFDDITTEHGVFGYGEWQHFEYSVSLNDHRFIIVSSPYGEREYLRYYFTSPAEACADELCLECEYPNRIVYIDNLRIEFETNPPIEVVYNSEGFTPLSPGALVGQDGWESVTNGGDASVSSTCGNPSNCVVLTNKCAVRREVSTGLFESVELAFDVLFAKDGSPYSSYVQLQDCAGKPLGNIFFYDGGAGVSVSVWARQGQTGDAQWIDTGIGVLDDDTWFKAGIALNLAEQRILRICIGTNYVALPDVYFADTDFTPPLYLALKNTYDGQATRIDNLQFFSGTPVVYREAPEIDILTVIYSEGVSASTIAEYKTNVIPLVQDFWFRNSHGTMLFNLDPLLRPIRPPASMYNTAPPVIDLRDNAGIYDDQYDIIMLWDPLPYSSPGLAGNWGGTRFGTWLTNFGETYGCQGEDFGMCRDIPYLTWVGIHEVQHSMDSMARRSGHPEFLHAHPDCCEPGAADGATDYSWCAAILRKFEAYDDYRHPWNGRRTYRDSDVDGLPDCDTNFPIDELRFASNPNARDTDNDGLPDLEEYFAGILTAADPNSSDTDGDGRVDGRDSYPIYPYTPGISRAVRVPTIDGVIEDGEWEQWGRGCGYSDDASFTLTTYATWTTGRLYFAFRANKKFALMFELDGSGTNSPWWGGDNFKLKNPYHRTSLYVASKESGPSSFTVAGALVGAEVGKEWNGAVYSLEVSIPANFGTYYGYGLFTNLNCLTLAPSNILGILMCAYDIGSGVVGSGGYIEHPYAFAFESLEYIDFTLDGYMPRIHYLEHFTDAGGHELVCGETNTVSLALANMLNSSVTATLGLSSVSTGITVLDAEKLLTNFPPTINELVGDCFTVFVPPSTPPYESCDSWLTIVQGGATYSNKLNFTTIPEPGIALVLALMLALARAAAALLNRH